MKGLSCKKYVKSFEITRKEQQHDFLDLFCRPAEPRFPIHIGISGYVAATGKVSEWNQDRIICFFVKNNQRSKFRILENGAI